MSARRQGRTKVIMALILTPLLLVVVLAALLLASLRQQHQQQARNQAAAHAALLARARSFSAVLASEFDRGALKPGPQPQWGEPGEQFYDVDVRRTTAAGAEVLFLGDATYSSPPALGFGESKESDPVCYQVGLVHPGGQASTSLTVTSTEQCLDDH